MTRQPDNAILCSKVHSIICLDGNFEQKHCTTTGLPINLPYTYFLSDKEIQLADQHVEACRKSKIPKKKPRLLDVDPALSQALEDDHIEIGLPLPNSSYDGCERSYIAADERNRKSDTGVFDVTGLMAAVCRHDRVLFILNITSAGEKQAYAIALLQKVLNGLPSHWRLGVLYDIGCQLDRSIKKVSHMLLGVSLSSINPFSSSIISHNSLNALSGLSQYSTPLDINGHASVFTTLRNEKDLGSLMEKGVSVAGHSSKNLYPYAESLG
jgi:hypothetical protein